MIFWMSYCTAANMRYGGFSVGFFFPENKISEDICRSWESSHKKRGSVGLKERSEREVARCSVNVLKN